jgi:hypothetical protein
MPDSTDLADCSPPHKIALETSVKKEVWRRVSRFDWKFLAALATVALLFCVVALTVRVT